MKKIDLGLLAGVLGGGQLAWLLGLSAKKFGIRTRVWDVSPDVSGFRSATERHASPWNTSKGAETFCKGLDLCTLEWESIPLTLLAEVEATGVPLHPSRFAVQNSSSRILERELFSKLGFGLAPWLAVQSPESLSDNTWSEFWGRGTFDKVFLKHDRGGYDGKGQIRLGRDATVEDAQNFFKLGDARGIMEAHADLAFEVSVIGARDTQGRIEILGLFENEHENGVLRVTRLVEDADARFDQAQARAMMTALLETTQYVGVAALELFVEKSGQILANEWAPRVHNSGHVTLDTHAESQFDWHWRALTGIGFVDNPVTRVGVMVNVLADDLTGEVSHTRSAILEATDPMPFLALHLRDTELRRVRRVEPYDYGKKDLKPGRKMGHLNVLF